MELDHNVPPPSFRHDPLDSSLSHPPARTPLDEHGPLYWVFKCQVEDLSRLWRDGLSTKLRV
jgi:hypothetical protein